MTAPARLDDLERLLGDPADDGNPIGNTAVLAADERDEMFAAGERVLDEYCLNAEFVPRRYGGRLAGADDLIQVLRTVFRRDPALGLGYGVSSFISSVNVWASGSPEQARWVAGTLLSNQKIASAYHELAHGNDFSRAEFAARPQAQGGWRLTGRKEVVTNVKRARGLVLLARTDERAGSRSHSQILVDKQAVPARAIRDLTRYPSVGMRGVQLGGIEFTDCPVGDEAVVGRPGQGIETALRSFQLTRTAIPTMLAGVLDSGLRLTLDFAAGRRLYGRSVADQPEVRRLLVDAYLDLLICDSLGLVVSRALHLLPGQTSMYASAVKYLVAKRLMDAMHQLSLVLGAHFYLREGRYGIFQKLLRDLAPAGFGHAARVACLGTMLPQVPLMARRGWVNPDPAGPDLFRIGEELPELPFDRLRVSAGGLDGLVGSLTAAADQIVGDSPEQRRLRLLAGQFRAELGDLAEAGAALHPGDLGVDARVEVLGLPARYATVLAASACLNVWLVRGDGPAWVVAALDRLARSIGRPGADRGDRYREPLYQELAARHADRRSFDLSRRVLPG
ncbi:Acyl-CoA dehydrogenase [Micromonospora phaseoli]|uniref:Acyl-CoA dehydrogenase n=1 Tax=Micromonospora phaseoli TaxID=1144548 RepID=A0A1H7AX06_9ACTN|nr:acyl-CoA dehydrogenase [Micromonospora phaseoli]PZV96168.1 alkylation response protein AidB-like acyl-CoA dehydrogenase [Micromonospora phaseoli]SEJ69154.1 Acyl-CoA dehydrogenase [Micromonospora phaseoli]